MSTLRNWAVIFWCFEINFSWIFSSKYRRAKPLVLKRLVAATDYMGRNFEEIRGEVGLESINIPFRENP